MTTPQSPAMVEVDRLPEPHVLDGHYRDHTDKVSGWSEQQVLEAIAAERAEVVRLRKAGEELVLATNYKQGVMASFHRDGAKMDFANEKYWAAFDAFRAALATPTQGEPHG